jgi:tryptophan-rich sensory protein
MNNTYDWYQTLIKPTWAPPAWIFGPVWTFLYIVIAVTFIMVFYKALNRKIPLLVALPFGLNLLFNLLFTPLQFGLQNNLLASIDILFVLSTLVWAMYAIWSYAKWIALANIPYLIWVSFATVLQLTITFLNWR